MRARVIKMIATAVTVAVLILGIPSVILGGILVWQADQLSLESRTQVLGNMVERRIQANEEVTTDNLRSWVLGNDPLSTGYIRVNIPEKEGLIERGEHVEPPRMTAAVVLPSGATLRTEVSAWPTLWKVIRLVIALVAGIIASLTAGYWLALRGSRRISAPLIYLAAQAEQIGSGQVRARVKPSGIEEIDLVQEELVRTGERMAGRLAAERQFASNASHQLRTPLTALSMRIEEIELLSDNEEVRNEARVSLEQVERLTQVINDLLKTTKTGGGNAEAIHVLEIFNQQREEWEEAFESEGRELTFTDEAAQPVLAASSVLSQVLATLIENSLHYGEGTTRVVCRKGTSSRGVMIDVSDEGNGVPEDMTELIFEKGVSARGSTGIGLPLARDLIKGTGGRLELTQNKPPIFTISLPAMPASLDPDVVMPEGILVSVGRRRRRF
ncbi:MAG: histidine kinase dimerization/phospho-acceptor domain-containing protein [Actinomycetaceae bacterium]|nr:histidine kinase dimerization/phospho-acceptor domain-containing protein [Actinomycetaceae bacterium]